VAALAAQCEASFRARRGPTIVWGLFVFFTSCLLIVAHSIVKLKLPVIYHQVGQSKRLGRTSTSCRYSTPYHQQRASIRNINNLNDPYPNHLSKWSIEQRQVVAGT
jgi:hypothetical protein